MERQVLGARGWVLGIALGLDLLGVLSRAGFADPLPATNTDSRPGITVRVYDYARVSPGEKKRAEEEASRVLRTAGVETVWVDCPTSPAEAQDYPACEPPLGAMAVDLKILSQSMAARVQSGREQLGFALPSTKAGSASAAWVFYHRVEYLAQSKDADQGQILGHAIAHEVGHLLLGPDRHSEKGIMRANWDRKTLQEAGRGQLLFTRQQAELVRTEVRVRAEVSRAPGVSLLHSPK